MWVNTERHELLQEKVLWYKSLLAERERERQSEKGEVAREVERINRGRQKEKYFRGTKKCESFRQRERQTKRVEEDIRTDRQKD